VKTATPWAAHLRDQTLAADISAGLAAVDSLMWESIKDEQPFVTETSAHLVNAGGKRIRPFLALLCAQFGAEPLAPSVISGATLCEILHIATLYHDDVMDEAKLRRGATSANARWGNTVAILTGDFMFAVASKIAAQLGPFVIDIQTATSRRLVTGQLRETIGWSPHLSKEEHYLKVISDKTSSLFAAACQIGARLAGASTQHTASVSRYAESLGMAFQLSDDVLDITGNETLGKQIGADLRAGVPTLPVIYIKQDAAPADARLLELLSSDLSNSEADVAEALALLREHEAIGRVRAKLRRYVDQSSSALAELPDTPAKWSLRSLAEFMIARQM
jgi:heptaprenyl diphosphate synthase